MPNPSGRPVCAVVGIGPGNGVAIARRFAAEGYAVALIARRTDHTGPLAAELSGSRAYVLDVADAAAVSATLAQIAAEMGPIDTLVYNAGKGVWGTFEEVTPDDFEAAWRTNTFGLFHCARVVAPAMVAAGQGTIVVIGATASLRGVAKTAAFAPAKAAQRALTQSLARDLWPKGVHVSLVIVDGVVGGPETRQMFAGRPDEFFIKPEGIADTVFNLTRQDRSAWSFEVETRPFGEKW